MSDNKGMDIQGLSVNTAQGQVREEAAVRVQAMAMQTMDERGEDLARLMDSANTNTITDPARGNHLNVLM